MANGGGSERPGTLGTSFLRRLVRFSASVSLIFCRLKGPFPFQVQRMLVFFDNPERHNPNTTPI